MEKKSLSDIVKGNAASSVMFSSLMTLTQSGIASYDNNSSYINELYKINSLAYFGAYAVSFFLFGCALDYFGHRPKKGQ